MDNKKSFLTGEGKSYLDDMPEGIVWPGMNISFIESLGGSKTNSKLYAFYGNEIRDTDLQLWASLDAVLALLDVYQAHITEEEDERHGTCFLDMDEISTPEEEFQALYRYYTMGFGIPSDRLDNGMPLIKQLRDCLKTFALDKIECQEGAIRDRLSEQPQGIRDFARSLSDGLTEILVPKYLQERLGGNYAEAFNETNNSFRYWGSVYSRRYNTLVSNNVVEPVVSEDVPVEDHDDDDDDDQGGEQKNQVPSTVFDRICDFIDEMSHSHDLVDVEQLYCNFKSVKDVVDRVEQLFSSWIAKFSRRMKNFVRDVTMECGKKVAKRDEKRRAAINVNSNNINKPSAEKSSSIDECDNDDDDSVGKKRKLVSLDKNEPEPKRQKIQQNNGNNIERIKHRIETMKSYFSSFRKLVQFVGYLRTLSGLYEEIISYDLPLKSPEPVADRFAYERILAWELARKLNPSVLYKRLYGDKTFPDEDGVVCGWVNSRKFLKHLCSTRERHKILPELFGSDWSNGNNNNNNNLNWLVCLVLGRVMDLDHLQTLETLYTRLDPSPVKNLVDFWPTMRQGRYQFDSDLNRWICKALSLNSITDINLVRYINRAICSQLHHYLPDAPSSSDETLTQFREQIRGVFNPEYLQEVLMPGTRLAPTGFGHFMESCIEQISKGTLHNLEYDLHSQRCEMMYDNSPSVQYHQPRSATALYLHTQEIDPSNRLKGWVPNTLGWDNLCDIDSTQHGQEILRLVDAAQTLFYQQNSTPTAFGMVPKLVDMLYPPSGNGTTSVKWQVPKMLYGFKEINDTTGHRLVRTIKTTAFVRSGPTGSVMNHVGEFKTWFRSLKDTCKMLTRLPPEGESAKPGDALRARFARSLLPCRLRMNESSIICLPDGSGFIVEIEQQIEESSMSQYCGPVLMNVLRCIVYLSNTSPSVTDEEKMTYMAHIMSPDLVECLFGKDFLGQETPNGVSASLKDRRQAYSRTFTLQFYLNFVDSLIHIVDVLMESDALCMSERFTGKMDHSLAFMTVMFRYFLFGQLWETDEKWGVEDPVGAFAADNFYCNRWMYMVYSSLFVNDHLDTGSLTSRVMSLFRPYSAGQFFERALRSWSASAVNGPPAQACTGFCNSVAAGGCLSWATSFSRGFDDFFHGLDRYENQTRGYLNFSHLLHKFAGRKTNAKADPLPAEQFLGDRAIVSFGAYEPSRIFQHRIRRWTALGDAVFWNTNGIIRDDDNINNLLEFPCAASFFCTSLEIATRQIASIFRMNNIELPRWINKRIYAEEISASDLSVIYGKDEEGEEEEEKVDDGDMDDLPQSLSSSLDESSNDSSSGHGSSRSNNPKKPRHTKELLMGCHSYPPINFGLKEAKPLCLYSITISGFRPYVVNIPSTKKKWDSLKNFCGRFGDDSDEEDEEGGHSSCRDAFTTDYEDSYILKLFRNLHNVMSSGYVVPQPVDDNEWNCGLKFDNCKDQAKSLTAGINRFISSEKGLEVLEFFSQRSLQEFSVFAERLRQDSILMTSKLTEYAVEALLDVDFPASAALTLARDIPSVYNVFSRKQKTQGSDDGGNEREEEPVPENEFNVFSVSLLTMHCIGSAPILELNGNSVDFPVRQSMALPPFNDLFNVCGNEDFDKLSNCFLNMRHSTWKPEVQFSTYMGMTCIVPIIQFLARVEESGMLNRLPCNFLQFLCPEPIKDPVKNPFEQARSLVYYGCSALVSQFAFNTPTVREWTDALDSKIKRTEQLCPPVDHYRLNEFTESKLTVQQGIMHMLCQLLKGADIKTFGGLVSEEPLPKSELTKDTRSHDLSMDPTIHLLSPPELEFIHFFGGCCSWQTRSLYKSMTFTGILKTCSLSLFRLPRSCIRSLHREAWLQLPRSLSELVMKETVVDCKVKYEQIRKWGRKCHHISGNAPHHPELARFISHAVHHPDYSQLVVDDGNNQNTVDLTFSSSSSSLQTFHVDSDSIGSLSSNSSKQSDRAGQIEMVLENHYKMKSYNVLTRQEKKRRIDFAIAHLGCLPDGFTASRLDELLKKGFVSRGGDRMNLEMLLRYLTSTPSSQVGNRSRPWNALEFSLATIYPPANNKNVTLLFSHNTICIGVSTDYHLANNTIDTWNHHLLTASRYPQFYVPVDDTTKILPSTGKGTRDFVQRTLVEVVTPRNTPNILVSPQCIRFYFDAKIPLDGTPTESSADIASLFNEHTVFQEEDLSYMMFDLVKHYHKLTDGSSKELGPIADIHPVGKPWDLLEYNGIEYLKQLSCDRNDSITQSLNYLNCTLEYLTWLFSTTVLGDQKLPKTTSIVHPASLLMFLFPPETIIPLCEDPKSSSVCMSVLNGNRLKEVQVLYYLACKTSMSSGVTPFKPDFLSSTILKDCVFPGYKNDNWNCDGMYRLIKESDENSREIQHIVQATDRMLQDTNQLIWQSYWNDLYVQCVGRSIPPHVYFNFMFGRYINETQYSISRRKSKSNIPCLDIVRDLGFVPRDLHQELEIIPSLWYFLPQASLLSGGKSPRTDPFLDHCISSFDNESRKKHDDEDYLVGDRKVLKSLLESIKSSDKRLSWCSYIWCYQVTGTGEMFGQELEIVRPFKLTAYRVFCDWLLEAPGAVQLHDDMVRLMGLTGAARTSDSLKTELCVKGTNHFRSMLGNMVECRDCSKEQKDHECIRVMTEWEQQEIFNYPRFFGCSSSLLIPDFIASVLTQFLDGNNKQLKLDGWEESWEGNMVASSLLYIHAEDFKKKHYLDCDDCNGLYSLRYCYCTHRDQKEHNEALDAVDEDSSEGIPGDIKPEELASYLHAHICQALNTMGLPHFRREDTQLGKAQPVKMVDRPQVIFNYDKLKPLYFEHLDRIIGAICKGKGLLALM